MSLSIKSRQALRLNRDSRLPGEGRRETPGGVSKFLRLTHYPTEVRFRMSNVPAAVEFLYLRTRARHLDTYIPENRVKCLRVNVPQELSYNSFSVLLHAVDSYGFCMVCGKYFSYLSREQLRADGAAWNAAEIRVDPSSSSPREHLEFRSCLGCCLISG